MKKITLILLTCIAVLVFSQYASAQSSFESSTGTQGVSNIPEGSAINSQNIRDRINLLVSQNGTTTRVPGGSTVLNYRQSAFGVDLNPILTSVGFTVTNSNGSGDLNTVLPSQAWDLAILQVHNLTLNAAEITAISNYIAGGGKLIMSYWALNSSAAVQALVGVSNTISFNTPISVSIWDGTHPIFNTPNTVGGLAVIGDFGGTDNGDRLEPATGATALAGFVPGVTTNEAAIILANGGNTIFHGFSALDLNLTSYINLIENEAEFLVTVSLPPTITCPGDITTNNDSGVCGAIVNYTLPVATSYCTEYIVNGTFETGDLTGWTLTNSGSGSFVINDGTLDPTSSLGPLPPISGGFDIVSNQGGPGTHLVSQSFTVPIGVNSATVSWNDRIHNYASVFSDPNQEFRVELLDATMTPIQEIFSTNPGDPTIQLGPNNRSFDLTALLQTLEGQQVYLRFSEQDNLNFFNITLDDISFIINSPIPLSLPVNQTSGLSSGSVFPVGTTTNTYEATDACGNTATCSFDVTVNDTENPIITCPSDITQSNDAGVCGANVTVPQPIVSDNCSISGSTALAFDGNNDYVNGPNDVVPITGKYTISVWAKEVNNHPGEYRNIFAQGRNLYLGYDNSGIIRCGDFWQNTGVLFPIDNLWHHYTVVRKTNDTELYIDGSLVASKGSSIPSPDGNAWGLTWPHNFLVGSQWFPSEYFDGQIDEIQIWSTALNENEIISNMNQRLLGTETNLVAYYNFEDGVSSNTLTDVISSSNNGVLTNMDVNTAWIASPYPISQVNLTNNFTNISNASAVFPVGTTTIEYTATDAAGNTATCSFDVTVNDTENPTWTVAPADMTVECDGSGNTADFSAWLTSFSGSDNCGTANVTNNSLGLSNGCGNTGTETVTFTLDDGNGNSITQAATFTIVDTTVPTIDVAASDLTVECDGAGNTSALNDWLDSIGTTGAASDICSEGGASPLYGLTSGTETDYIQDSDDNTEEHNLGFNFTFFGNTFSSVHIGSNGTLSFTSTSSYCCSGDPVDNGSYENVIAFMNTDLDPGDQSDDMITYQTLGVAPNREFVVSYFQVPNYDDTDLRHDGQVILYESTGVIDIYYGGNDWVLYDDMTIGISNATGNVGVAAAGWVQFDNITSPTYFQFTPNGASYDVTTGLGASSVTWTNDFTALSDDCGATGSALVTFTATDDCGNFSTTQATFTIEDTTPALIACPGDVTAIADPGSCGAIVVFQPAVALEECGWVIVAQTGGLGSGSVFPVGDTLVEFTATDECFNTSTCTFTITVEDTEAPVVNCNDLTIQLDEFGTASITAEDVDGVSTDNCGIATLSIDIDTFDCSNVGANTVVLTVTDVHGNAATCSATVMVEDITPPEVFCQDLTVALDANGTAVITGMDMDAGSTDACGIGSYELSMDTFDCNYIGNNTVTLYVTDVNGNMSSCTATVTVEDNIAPTLVCTDVTIELGPDGITYISPSDLATVEDPCGVVVFEADLTQVSCADIGAPITVSVFAIDSNGNPSFCSSVVTVVDLLGPAIVCPPNEVVIVEPNGTYTLGDYIADGIATVTDNCSDPVTIFTQSPAAGTLLGYGIHDITFTAEDEYGNVATCSFELNIQELLGTTDNELGSLVLYPNPANNQVYLSNPSQLELNEVIIYDLTGRMVNRVDLSNMGLEKTIDISSLANATYMVIINGAQGTTTKQLIVGN